MNRKTTLFGAGSAAAGFAAALALPLHAAQSARVEGGKLSVIHSEAINDDGQDSKSEAVEVRIEDGKITVKRNGKEVPASQIKLEGGRVIILDEDGNELKGLSIGAHGDGHAFWVGQGGEFGEFPGGGQGFTFVGGDVPKVMIGVHMGEAGPALEKHLGLKGGKTTMITNIIKGLPAEKAGLQQYDIIVAIEGAESPASDAIMKALASKEPGDVVKLKVIQAGKPKTFDVTLDAYDAKAMGAAGMFGGEFMPRFGELNLDELPMLKGHENVFVVPEGGRQWDELAPKIHEHFLRQFGGAQAGGGGAGGAGAGDIEEKLNRLDQRMADLEALLQKLIEQRGGTR